MGQIGVARPPLGWNSWDCYGTTVREDEVLANARFLADNLAGVGWNTVVVDIDWADPTAKPHGYNLDAPLVMDGWGRLIPDPGRFPSALGGVGFRGLADVIHDLGLRFGIHIMRGVPRRAVAQNLPILGTSVTAAGIARPGDYCAWNPDMVGVDVSAAGGQAYYDSIARLYAEWGVDFIKADDMLSPYHADEIEALARAIDRSSRPMELSLSPGTGLSLAHLDHLRANATMWRICDDVWDRWDDVASNAARFARWTPHVGPEGWPDGDMLPLGHIGIRGERGADRMDRLTPTERRTMVTLWAMARSPFMVGGDLPSSDPTTIALLRQPAILGLQQFGVGNRELLRDDTIVLWGAEVDGRRRAALFNLGPEPVDYRLDLSDAGFRRGEPIIDLWTNRPLVASESASTICTVDSHGVRLLGT